LGKFSLMEKISEEFDRIIAICRDIFVKKNKDYGVAWRVMRLSSLTDQIFIKVHRIRTIQENSEQKIAEDQVSEFIGIVNYSIMALIQLEKGVGTEPDLTFEQVITLYDQQVAVAKKLMLSKNHDYGQAWRLLQISSITDLIFQKVLRIKQIEKNKGKTIISEGLDANYQDMLNYSVFAVILSENATHTKSTQP